MTDNLKKWMELVSQDAALKAELNQYRDQPREVQTAAEMQAAEKRGIYLTEEDYRPISSGELSDDELQAVAAGGGCGCYVVGGGGGTQAEDGDIYGCACFNCGGGGDGTEALNLNCVCIAAGVGED